MKNKVLSLFFFSILAGILSAYSVNTESATSRTSANGTSPDTIQKIINHLKDGCIGTVCLKLTLKDATQDAADFYQYVCLDKDGGRVYNITDRNRLKAVQVLLEDEVSYSNPLNLYDKIPVYSDDADDSDNDYRFHVEDVYEQRYTVGSDNFIRQMDLKDDQ